jgi:hypothetical protein
LLNRGFGAGGVTITHLRLHAGRSRGHDEHLLIVTDQRADADLVTISGSRMLMVTQPSTRRHVVTLCTVSAGRAKGESNVCLAPARPEAPKEAPATEALSRCQRRVPIARRSPLPAPPTPRQHATLATGPAADPHATGAGGGTATAAAPVRAEKFDPLRRARSRSDAALNPERTMAVT